MIPTVNTKVLTPSIKDKRAEPKVIELVANTPLTQTFEYIDEVQDLPSIGDISVSERSPHTNIEEHDLTIIPTDQTMTSANIIASEELIVEETMVVDGRAVETNPVTPNQPSEYQQADRENGAAGETIPTTSDEPENQTQLEETDNIEIIKEIPKSNMKVFTFGRLTWRNNTGSV